MSSSHGWRKHNRESVALTIVLFSALCLGLILALASCAPVATAPAAPAATAPAAPAAEPTKAAEATKPAEEQPAAEEPAKCQFDPEKSGCQSVPETSIRFGGIFSPEEEIHIQKQVDAFMKDCPPIKVTLQRYWTSTQEPDPEVQLRTEIAAGIPLDVIGIWGATFSRLAPQNTFMQLEGVSTECFMNGAEKAGQVNGASYALPWSRYLCTPDYRVLGIWAQTKGKDASRLLIDYLTAPAQQTDNAKYQMENVPISPTWYPTQQSVNDELAGCQNNDQAAKWPTGGQRDQVRAKIEKDLVDLQTKLKGTKYWPDDQPTVFNFDWTTGLGIPVQDDKPQYDDKQQYTVVQAGAVPVMSGDEQFFLEENLRQYAEGKETTYVTVGGLRVFDPSALDGKLAEGTYAVVWEYTVNAERLIFVDIEGKETYAGQLWDLNGKLVDRPADPWFQVLQPWVVAEGDASWLSWLFDSRGGKAP